MPTTSKEISGLHIKPVDLQDPTLFRLNQNFDFLAQLILKSQGQISSISATVNSLLGTTGLLTGLHADRVATPASANQLTLFWEQDRDALYASIDVSGTWTWVWAYDDMRDVFANRPADLGANDAGFTFEDTTPGYTYRWNGATWDVVEVLTDLVTIVKSGADAPAYLRSYGGTPRVIFQQAGGTSAAPTKTVSGAAIMQIGGRGYEQVTPGFAAADKVAIIGSATQDWTAAAQGTQITLEVTPSGSTTRAAAVTITSTNTTVAGTLTVNAGAATGTLVSITTSDAAGYLNLTAGARTVRFGADGSIGPHFGSTTHAGIFFPDADDLLPMVALTPSSSGIVNLGRAGYWFGTLFSAGDVSFSRNASHSVLVERRTTANSAGTNLTLQAAGATVGATAKAGGTVKVYGGISTDTAGSTVEFGAAQPGAVGSGDHSPTTKMTLDGYGSLTFDPGATPGYSQIKLRANALGALEVKTYAADNHEILWDLSYEAAGYVAKHTDAFRFIKAGGNFKFTRLTGQVVGSALDPAGQSTAIMVQLSDGFVRIGGSTAPGYQLDVTGDINSSASYRTGGTEWLNSTRDANFATLKTADITATGAIPCADADDTLIESGIVAGSGIFTTYNATATEGLGVPAIVDRVAETAKSAAIGSTNFTNAGTAGEYEVEWYIVTTTADATAGTVTLNFAWTDDAAARTVSSSALGLTTTGYLNGRLYVRLNSGSVAYSTTIGGAVNNARYALYMSCKRVG